MPPREIVSNALDAKLALGIERRHLGYGLCSVADKGAYLELQLSDRFEIVFKDFTD